MAEEVCEAAVSEAAQQHGAASSAAESEHESGNSARSLHAAARSGFVFIPSVADFEMWVQW